MQSYVPTRLADYHIHRTAVSSLQQWIKEFVEGKKERGAVFLIGPPGCGKTSLARLVFKEHGYDTVEFQPDSTKTHKAEMARLRNIVQTQNVGMMFTQRRKAVLFDDIEVGANNDRGFLADVIQLVEKQSRYSNPVIFTLNVNVKTKKLTTIEKYANRIYLNRLSQYEMFQVGKLVVAGMKLPLADFRLQFLANSCQGDIRCLYQGLEVHARSLEPKVPTNPEPQTTDNSHLSIHPDIDEEIEDIPDQEAWAIYAKKELEVNPLYNIENLLIPTNRAVYHQYQDIYDADTLFVPANIYENSWPVLKATKLKKALSH